MHAISLLIFLLFSFAAGACPEEKAKARVREEAESLNGQIEAFVRLPNGRSEGLIRSYIQHWNGSITQELFLIEVDRDCLVSIWKK